VFRKEAHGLRCLAFSKAVHTPDVVAEIDLPEEDLAALVLEVIETGQPNSAHWRRFGGELAMLHQTATSEQFGFDVNNYLGASPQRNDWNQDWATFFAEQRLHAQLKMACEQFGESVPQSIIRRTERLIANLSQVLNKSTEPAALLHGDLWSGNVLFDRAGHAYLIDPAPYYGDREAEWGMIELFGHFPATFLEGYQQTSPFSAGAEVRIAVYRLYHLLNHWNLFGSSYLPSCEGVLRELGY
jgi:fructosamine-3-kinase